MKYVLSLRVQSLFRIDTDTLLTTPPLPRRDSRGTKSIQQNKKNGHCKIAENV